MIITKIEGGGESYHYLIGDDGKIMGVAHEDNRKDMRRLQHLQMKFTEQQIVRHNNVLQPT